MACGEESRKVGRMLPHLENTVDKGEKEENPNKRRRGKRKWRKRKKEKQIERGKKGEKR